MSRIFPKENETIHTVWIALLFIEIVCFFLCSEQQQLELQKQVKRRHDSQHFVRIVSKCDTLPRHVKQKVLVTVRVYESKDSFMEFNKHAVQQSAEKSNEAKGSQYGYRCMGEGSTTPSNNRYEKVMNELLSILYDSAIGGASLWENYVPYEQHCMYIAMWWHLFGANKQPYFFACPLPFIEAALQFCTSVCY